MGSFPASPFFCIGWENLLLEQIIKVGSNIKEVVLDLVNQVVKELKQAKIEVFDYYQIEGQNDFVILGEKMIIHCNLGENIVSVSFHVSARSEYVARVILSLNNLTAIIKVAESFWYDEKNNLISGKEAYEKFEEVVSQEIIQGFMKTQHELQVLFSRNCYNV